MARCELLPEDCAADHVLRVLDGLPQPAGGWRARCPAHDDQHRSLTISVGTRGARLIWQCHRRPACSGQAVREAMIRRGISAGCLGTSRPTSTEEDDRLNRIEKLITDPPAGLQRMRIELAMVLWECDALTAAAKLGIGWRTAYRARDSR